MQSNFFSMVLRMKYINRWGLMRNTRQESLSEHTLDVAVLTHALCIIAKKRFGRAIDPNLGAVIALYHDAPEIITGDMPTPIKYRSPEMISAYKQVEHEAVDTLLARLPEDLREEYRDLFEPQAVDDYMMRLVKAADKLSALIKCVEEEQSGNSEFVSAKKSTLAQLEASGLPEVEVFMSEFFEGFTKTLDEQ